MRDGAKTVENAAIDGMLERGERDLAQAMNAADLHQRRAQQHAVGRLQPIAPDLLLADVDPCGEHGEFHSFACAGPMFTEEIKVKTGEVVDRDGFVFSDLVLSS